MIRTRKNRTRYNENLVQVQQFLNDIESNNPHWNVGKKFYRFATGQGYIGDLGYDSIVNTEDLAEDWRNFLKSLIKTHVVKDELEAEENGCDVGDVAFIASEGDLDVMLAYPTNSDGSYTIWSLYEDDDVYQFKVVESDIPQADVKNMMVKWLDRRYFVGGPNKKNTEPPFITDPSDAAEVLSKFYGLSESASGNDWCSVALNIYDELWKYHFEKVAKQSAQFNELDIKYGLDLVCDDFPVYREAADVAERDGLKDNFVQWLTYFLINRAEFEGYNVKQIAKPERLTEAHVDRPYYMIGPVNKDKAYQIRDEVYNHFIGNEYAKTKVTIEDVTEYILDKYGVDSTGIAEEIMYALGVDETKRLRRANNGRAPYLTIESKKNYGHRLNEENISFLDSIKYVMEAYNSKCVNKKLEQVDYKLSTISYLGRQGDGSKKAELIKAYIVLTKTPLDYEILDSVAKIIYTKRVIPNTPKEKRELATLSTFGVSNSVQIKEELYGTLISKVPASEKPEESLKKLTKVLERKEYKKEEPTPNNKNLDIIDVRKERPKSYDADDPYKPSKPMPGETKTTEIMTGKIVGGFADAIAKGAMNPTSASDNKNKYFTIE